MTNSILIMPYKYSDGLYIFDNSFAHYVYAIISINHVIRYQSRKVRYGALMDNWTYEMLKNETKSLNSEEFISSIALRMSFDISIRRIETQRV